MPYLVRCSRCDRAFWQTEREAPVGDHTRWDRRVPSRPDEEDVRCTGSARQGYWIGEGAGPLAGWPE